MRVIQKATETRWELTRLTMSAITACCSSFAHIQHSLTDVTHCHMTLTQTVTAWLRVSQKVHESERNVTWSHSSVLHVTDSRSISFIAHHVSCYVTKTSANTGNCGLLQARYHPRCAASSAILVVLLNNTKLIQTNNEIPLSLEHWTSTIPSFFISQMPFLPPGMAEVGTA